MSAITLCNPTNAVNQLYDICSNSTTSNITSQNGMNLIDQTTPAFHTQLYSASSPPLTSNCQLTINVANGNKIIGLAGNLTVSSGNVSLNAGSGASTVSLPPGSVTMCDLTTSQSLGHKTFDSASVSFATTSLGAKHLTLNTSNLTSDSDFFVPDVDGAKELVATEGKQDLSEKRLLVGPSSCVLGDSGDPSKLLSFDLSNMRTASNSVFQVNDQSSTTYSYPDSLGFGNLGVLVRNNSAANINQAASCTTTINASAHTGRININGTSMTTAPGSSFEFNWINSFLDANSVILFTVRDFSGPGVPLVTTTSMGSSSCNVKIFNVGAAAFTEQSFSISFLVC